MTSGVYARTEKHLEALCRQAKLNCATYFLPYAKSIKGREIARKNLITYNKSQKHRDSVIKMNKIYNFGGKSLELYNKTDKHREDVRNSDKHKLSSSQRMKKWINSEDGINHQKKLRHITKSQKILNKKLLEDGWDTKMEMWIPEIRRFVDIAIPEIRLAVEVDGASHYNKNFLKRFGISLEEKNKDDELKDRQLRTLGWKVLRVVDKNIKNDLSDLVKEIKNESGDCNSNKR